MDAATLLDHYTHDMANLPVEMQQMLSDLRKLDLEYDKTLSKIQLADSQIFKYIKQHGSITRHPKEDLLTEEIGKYYAEARKIQDEKTILANTALMNIAKYATKLDQDVKRLVETGAIDHWDVSDDDVDMLDAGTGEGDPAGLLSAVERSASLNSRKVSTPPVHAQGHGVNEITKRMNGSSLEANSQRMPKKSSRDKTPQDTRDSTPGGSRGRRDIANGTAAVKGPNRRAPSGNGVNNDNGNSNGNGNGNGEDDELYCFCQQVSYGEMVACDNPNCKYEWFHYDCVGLTEPPSGVWFCPDCRKDGKNVITKRDKKKK